MKRTIKRVKDVLQGKAPLNAKRSTHWPTVRKNFLKLNPSCAACGDTAKLEVHHKMPFHLDPSLELDPNNLITLCESDSYGIICHLYIGHLGNYKKFNPNVTEDAASVLKRLNESKA